MSAPVKNAAGLIGNMLNTAQRHVKLLAEAGKCAYQLRTTDLLTTLVSGSVVFALGLCILLFTNLSLAFWINRYLESFRLSFLATAGVNIVVLGTGIALYRKKLKTRLRNSILSRIAAGAGSYAEVSATDARLQKEIAISEASLSEDLGLLKQEIAAITGAPDNNNRKPVGNGKTTAEAVGFILKNIVLTKAGPVKKFVLPLIARAATRLFLR